MFQDFIAIVLFILPGVVSELHYLKLSEQNAMDHRLTSLARALSFSVTVLLFRCIIAIVRGHGAALAIDPFIGLSNLVKYILLAAVMSILMPNAYLLLNELYTKITEKLFSRRV